MSESLLLQGFSFFLSQVILAEVLCDCSSSQAVVKELRVSASPLEQRKFLAESEPYRQEKALKSATLWQQVEPADLRLFIELDQMTDVFIRIDVKDDKIITERPISCAGLYLDFSSVSLQEPQTSKHPPVFGAVQ